MSEMSDIKTGVDPDPNAPIYRVPSQSYWAELAQKELEEASNNPVKDIHTVLCVDISDSVSQGSAWEQTQQFFNDFITGIALMHRQMDKDIKLYLLHWHKGLEEARKESEINVEYVALSVFGGEVKVVQRLTMNYTLLKQAFCALRLGGPSPLVGGLLMALAGLSNTSRPSCNGIRIRPRIILITDGHPTNSHIVSGPDVCHSEPMEQVAVLLAVSNISSKIIRLHCVPVGNANLPFLEKASAQSHGKLYTYKDGRMLARRTLCTMKSNLQISSSSAEEQEDILHIAREALDTNPEDDDDAEINTDHYEHDDSDVSLPSLGTRVRRGPDWDKGFQDNDGPGTIVGHHKDKKQVKVEWDRTGHSCFYRYGDMEQYDVLIDTEPRVLQSELIATGCLVRRGKNWKYDNQDGTPDAIGVVLKVKDDGIVVVRWPNKSKNYYRYGAEACFDLEICHPDENSAKSVKSKATHHEHPLGLGSFISQESQTQQYSVQKYHNECLRLPPLGTRVRRGVGWNKSQEDHNGPGTIIGHNEDKSQVYVEWDGNGQHHYYYFKDMENSEVVVVDEPRVLQPGELIVTGCHVKRGTSWMYGDDNGTPDATGVVLNVRDEGMVLVRWKNKSKCYYRYGAEGQFDLEICKSCDNQIEQHMSEIERCDPTSDLSNTKSLPTGKGRDKNKFPKKKGRHEASSRISIHEQTEPNIVQEISHLHVHGMNEIQSSSTIIPTIMTTDETNNTTPETTSTTRDVPKTTITSNMPSISAAREMPTTSIATDPPVTNSTVAITSTAIPLATAISAELRGVPEAFDRKRNIVYKKKELIGRGWDGTYVYRGKFDERDVAVKRLLKENFIYADQEVKLLRESDQHPNVIRYFWMEEDADFICIALELCQGNLEDYVKDKLTSKISIEPTKLLHQALSGLAHLHSLGIVHRDIKPQNILISKPSPLGEVRAMISDFGFSKKLPSEATSFSSRSNVLGTEGWMSPEMSASGLKKTTAVDIFSAGCVIHYVLTKGLHPFGKLPSDIQCNIRKGEYILDRLPLTSDGFIAKDIIKKMLSADPKHRPTAKGVLNHLLFWTKTEKLQFIEATSDWIVVKMVPEVEKDGVNIVRSDWTKHLSQELQNDIRKDFREKSIRYSGSSVKDLLRLIRNKRHHYNKMAENVRKSIGSPQDEYLDYFTTRFPLLLLHIYHVMECYAKEDTFKTFYKPE